MTEGTNHEDADHGSSHQSTVSVYIVEDHDDVRSRLVDLIASSPGLTVAGSSGVAHVALEEIDRLQPDVALVDGRLDGVSGLDVCSRLQRTAPTVSCVILTSAVTVPWGRAEAAHAGAAAYLVKQLGDFPLVDTISRVAAGDRPIDDEPPS